MSSVTLVQNRTPRTKNCSQMHWAMESDEERKEMLNTSSEQDTAITFLTMDGDAPQVDPRQAELDQKRRDIACIKRNLLVERMPLSKTIESIYNHCFEHAQADPLLCPSKDNPYKIKRSCFVC